ncbi:MAG: stage 0 sporulation family protein [Clostridia bacterium]|nr:stage 0 sporulation family protein [Clostridia bacterium]
MAKAPAAPAAEVPAPRVEVVGVSFRSAGKKYYFSPGRLTLHTGDEVIVETARGMEFGRITVGNTTVPATEITPPLRLVTRIASDSDRARYARNRELEAEAVKVCREKIARHKLEMNLIAAEYTFDNSKLLFYFTAEGRVDVRELVKDLASVFHTRIELRQVGIRDEAKILGGLGVCGRPFCCSTFLPDFVQVSIKMAKEQNFSLNSAKISGACGRLMCCLRYEHETYEEALKKTPPNGAYVETAAGCGVVVETRPLLSIVKVRLDEKPEAPKLFPCEEVTVLANKAPKPGEERPVPTARREAKEPPAEKPKEAPKNGQKNGPKEGGEATQRPERTGGKHHRGGRGRDRRGGKKHHPKQENS